MSEGLIIALSGLGGLIIGGFFTYITTRLTSNSSKELAIIASQNSIDLALIAAGQLKTDEVMERYHKEVNSKMTLLLETTGAAREAEGNLKGKAQNQKETDAKPQEKK